MGGLVARMGDAERGSKREEDVGVSRLGKGEANERRMEGARRFMMGVKWVVEEIKKPIPAGQTSIGVCNRFLNYRNGQSVMLRSHLSARVTSPVFYPYDFSIVVTQALFHEYCFTRIISRASSAGFA